MNISTQKAYVLHKAIFSTTIEYVWTAWFDSQAVNTSLVLRQSLSFYCTILLYQAKPDLQQEIMFVTLGNIGLPVNINISKYSEEIT